MFRALAVAVAISSAHAQSRPIQLTDLTVPKEDLPAECRLTPAEANPGTPPTQVPDVHANPWSGTDTAAIAWIRQRMDGPPQVPDGPPLDRRAAARYLLRWADGLEEGYGAGYTDRGQPLIVHALRFGEGVNDPPKSVESFGTRVDIGRVVAFVYGKDSDCFRAVVTHLKLLASKR